jgi:8-oxo-dGTP diphosphatase
MNQPQLCVGAVAVSGDRLLMIRRGTHPGKGLWSLPGGRVEPDEMLAIAVTRELREETGLDGVCGPLIGWVENFGSNYHFVIMDFEVTVLDPRDPVAGDDAMEAAWIALHDVAELHLVDGLAEFLADHDVISIIA